MRVTKAFYLILIVFVISTGSTKRHTNEENSRNASERSICRWQPWGEWSDCDAICGGNMRGRRRYCECPDENMKPDCKGPAYEQKYCESNCVRPGNYWKYHSKYAIEKSLMKPWPISEDTTFLCDDGYDEMRAQATWYEVMVAHPEFDNWAFLVDELVTAALNIESGANDRTVHDNLTAAEDLIRNCAGWTNDQIEFAEELRSLLLKFNSGQFGPKLCRESPCCFFSGWEPWGVCTQPCGGVRSRYEKCVCPAFFGTPDESWCSGHPLKETEQCNTDKCDSNTDSTTVENQMPAAEIEISDLDQTAAPIIEGNCFWGDWGNWSTCSQECGGGRQWRERMCYCPEMNNGSSEEFCSQLPEPRQYKNCNLVPCLSTVNSSDSSEDNSGSYVTPKAEPQSPFTIDSNTDPETDNDSEEDPPDESVSECFWREWGEWSSCSSECDGNRWRKRQCYCENFSGAYDDTFCDGFPSMEDEPCNQGACTYNQCEGPEYWRTHNRYATGSFYKPWPIPETTSFVCNRGEDPDRTEQTWLEILSENKKISGNNNDSTNPNDDIWHVLAREYISAILNTKNGARGGDSAVHSALIDAAWLLRDCDGYDAPDIVHANEATAVLRKYNGNGHTVDNIGVGSSSSQNEDSTAFTGGSSTDSSTPQSTIGWAAAGAVLVAVIFAVIVTVSVMRWRYSQRVFEIPDDMEPDFQLPDSDDEDLLNFDVKKFAQGSDDEDIGGSYELGEMEDLQL